MTNQIETIMALADEYAKAWHASQTSRLIAAYDDGDHRKALKQALEAALKPGEPDERDAVLRQALSAFECIDSPLYVREINKVGAAIAAIKEILG